MSIITSPLFVALVFTSPLWLTVLGLMLKHKFDLPKGASVSFFYALVAIFGLFLLFVSPGNPAQIWNSFFGTWAWVGCLVISLVTILICYSDEYAPAPWISFLVFFVISLILFMLSIIIPPAFAYLAGIVKAIWFEISQIFLAITAQ